MINKLQPFSPAMLKTLAGERSYARGVHYFDTGAVIDLVDTGKAIKAIVRGNDDYHVTLYVKSKRLNYDCDCPVGESGECCKHVVAAGLAWLAQQIGTEVPPVVTGRDEWQVIRAYLFSIKQDKLVEMLLAQAENDPVLRNILSMQAAHSVPGYVDTKAMKRIINQAMSVRGFVDYRGMRRFIQKAQAVTQMLDDLWRDQEAAAVAELAEYALLKGFKSYERTDDSDGGFGHLLLQVTELYQAAVPKAGIDPTVLGKRLFELQMRDQWDFIHFQDYTDCLGKAGLAAFRQAAEAAWRKQPARKKDDDGDSDRYTLTTIMEGLARFDNDVDGLIAIKSRDLSSTYRYLEIAELLQKAKREDEALAWAERGRKASPKQLDVRLDEFIIRQYHQRKRHDDALQLAWQHFTDHPSLQAYKRVQASAKYTKATKVWRDKAIDWLQKAGQKEAKKNPRSPFAWQQDFTTPLIEIHLAEDDSDTALNIARKEGCRDSLWLQIAAVREKDHPQDTIEIYQKLVETYVNRTNNDAYAEAAKLIKKIAGLMPQGKRGKAFKAYLEQLCVKFKAKRNFVKMLGEF